MKLNLKFLLFSAAVMAILVVASPLCSFAQESELVSRPYLEKSSTNNEVSEENMDAVSEEENGFFAKDSIVSSAAAANRSNHGASHRQRAKNTNDPSKQTEGQKAEKNEEKDSILSFNFIYYIFKKFKWSDIAD